MKTNFIKLGLASIAALALVLTGCDKMLELEPGDVIIATDALQTPDDAQRLLNSNYDVLGNLYDGRVQNCAELLSSNLAIPENNNDYVSVYNRETNFFTSFTNSIYTDFYRAIYRGNVLIENFDLIEGLSETDRTRMEAEVRFIRALCHFQVVKLWAQPYGYTAGNSHLGIPVREAASQEPLPRNTVNEVYEFILEDLIFAYDNLPMTNDVYATRYSAAGVLAQVYFQMMDYPNAAIYAGEVVNSGLFILDTDLDRYEEGVVNTETVFGIVSNPLDVRNEGFRDNYRSDNNPSPTLTFDQEIANTLGLNPSDGRNDWFLQDGGIVKVTRFNNKEFYNIPIIHLTEMMLIQSESLAETATDLTTAIENINLIRDRAFGEGFNDLDPGSSAEEVIEAARLEYLKETLCEGKLIDQLKRRGAMGEDITVRNAPWDCPGMAIQFPNGETSAAGFILNEEGGCN
ncbi:MAG: RagB/SusD family nutrient uptake outer membrane protein [Flavobacteriales bacterium]|nr:RagB/SusD family nutrient uptake outer membrane protein [Flavobacteriales bacterium]MDG2247159.1 RagB/SusD family nutrient uptake outer membrane protein [Flavobacteriales bacterium]